MPLSPPSTLTFCILIRLRLPGLSRSPRQPPEPVSSSVSPQARAEPPVRHRPALLSHPPGRGRASPRLIRHGGAGRPQPGPGPAPPRPAPPPPPAAPLERVRRARVRAAGAPLGRWECRWPQAGGDPGRRPASREGAVRRGEPVGGRREGPRWGRGRASVPGRGASGAAVGEAGLPGPGSRGERGVGARSVLSAPAAFPAPFTVTPTVPGLWAWRCCRGRVEACSECFVAASVEL